MFYKLQVISDNNTLVNLTYPMEICWFIHLRVKNLYQNALSGYCILTCVSRIDQFFEMWEALQWSQRSTTVSFDESYKGERFQMPFNWYLYGCRIYVMEVWPLGYIKNYLWPNKDKNWSSGHQKLQSAEIIILLNTGMTIFPKKLISFFLYWSSGTFRIIFWIAQNA